MSTFEELVLHVAPIIAQQDTQMREAISPEERLALTLRFLATGKQVTHYEHNIISMLVYTGECFESLKFLCRLPAQTIGRIVPEM